MEQEHWVQALAHFRRALALDTSNDEVYLDWLEHTSKLVSGNKAYAILNKLKLRRITAKTKTSIKTN
jgi:hypothetical protein